MGWEVTYTEKPGSLKQQEEIIKEMFLERYNNVEVIKHKLIKSNWYAIAEVTKDDGSKYKFIAVCMVSWSKSTQELQTKWLDASVGPYAYDCPISWFDEVPVMNDFDAKWRKHCIELRKKNTEKAKLLKSIGIGDKVKFSCAYAGVDTWVYLGNNRFGRNMNAIPTKLVNWKKHIEAVIS